MNDDDSFNESDEIFNLYSSKKVTETYKAQLRKLLSGSGFLSKKNEISTYCNRDNKQINETLGVSNENSNTELISLEQIQTVQDSEDSIEVIAEVPKTPIRRSCRLKNKREKYGCISFCEDYDSDSDTSSNNVGHRRISADALLSSTSRKVKNIRKAKKKSIVIEGGSEVVNLDISLELNNVEELNPEYSIKVLWKSTIIKKFQIRKFQKLLKIFQELAEEEGVSENKIMLTYNSVKINHNDTPNSLNLKVFDILEGGILSELNDCKTSTPQTPNLSKQTMILKFHDSDKVVVKLAVNKYERIKIAMIEYSEQVEIPLNNIKFYFDGELLDAEETPISMGLDNDDIIDVKVNV